LDEVPRIGRLEIRVARFREAQGLPGPFAVAAIHGLHRYEVQVVCVEAKNAQQPRQARQVAVDNLLEVRYPAMAPIFQMARGQQLHGDKQIDGCHDLPLGKDRAASVLDPAEERVGAEVLDAGARCFRPGTG
jgi:hypothetical protein